MSTEQTNSAAARFW